MTCTLREFRLGCYFSWNTTDQSVSTLCNLIVIFLHFTFSLKNKKKWNRNSFRVTKGWIEKAKKKKSYEKWSQDWGREILEIGEKIFIIKIDGKWSNLCYAELIHYSPLLRKFDLEMSRLSLTHATKLNTACDCLTIWVSLKILWLCEILFPNAIWSIILPGCRIIRILLQIH